MALRLRTSGLSTSLQGLIPRVPEGKEACFKGPRSPGKVCKLDIMDLRVRTSTQRPSPFTSDNTHPGTCHMWTLGGKRFIISIPLPWSQRPSSPRTCSRPAGDPGRRRGSSSLRPRLLPSWVHDCQQRERLRPTRPFCSIPAADAWARPTRCGRPPALLQPWLQMLLHPKRPVRHTGTRCPAVQVPGQTDTELTRRGDGQGLFTRLRHSHLFQP